jgi:hypothetical protein
MAVPLKLGPITATAMAPGPLYPANDTKYLGQDIHTHEHIIRQRLCLKINALHIDLAFLTGYHEKGHLLFFS